MKSLAGLTFISYQRLTADVLAWERLLPTVDAVVGVPRSGILPATLLALRRNIRLVTLESLLADPQRCIELAPIRGNNPLVKHHPKPLVHKLLIVDDSCSQDVATLSRLRERLNEVRLPFQVYLGVLYAEESTGLQELPVDYVYRIVPKPRLFEWNFFRHYDMHYAMWDIDGAICADWRGREEESPAEYERHIREAPPLYVPERPVGAVCTNRLPCWRAQTAEWLARHHVQYQELLMSPYATPQDRREHDRPRGSAKARTFAASPCQLFIESDADQAHWIARESGRPVLCLDEMRLYP
jgi:hypothetical protein